MSTGTLGTFLVYMLITLSAVYRIWRVQTNTNYPLLIISKFLGQGVNSYIFLISTIKNYLKVSPTLIKTSSLDSDPSKRAGSAFCVQPACIEPSSVRIQPACFIPRLFSQKSKKKTRKPRLEAGQQTAMHPSWARHKLDIFDSSCCCFCCCNEFSILLINFHMYILHFYQIGDK